jgi:DNA polymerase III subunit epsilon
VKTQKNFWWFVCVAVTAIMIALASIGLLFWRELDPAQADFLITLVKVHFAYIFAAALLMFAAFGFALDWVFRFYIIPINQLAEQTNLLHTVNPDLVIDVDGCSDVMRLGDIINHYTQQHRTSCGAQAHIHLVKSQSETERNILASLLEDLPQGILACTIEGRIVLYNRKAHKLLAQHRIMPTEENLSESGKWIGLGRSIFSFIDQSLIMPALERIGRNLSEGHSMVHEKFLVETTSKALLPAEIIPVLDVQHHLSGFILYIEDQTSRLMEEKQRAEKLQSWKNQMVQAVTAIKATVEIFTDEPDAGISPEYGDLIQLLAKEAELAAGLVSSVDHLAPSLADRPLPLTPIDAFEWTCFLGRRAFETSQIEMTIEQIPPSCFISIDIHHFTSGMLFVLHKIKDTAQVASVKAQLYVRQKWLYLDLFWNGAAIDQSTLMNWTRSLLQNGDNAPTFPFYTILNVHGAKLWIIQTDLPSGSAGLRLLVPSLEEDQMIEMNGRITVLPGARPEFYDFDLFKTAEAHPELDDRPLKELIFTVFDTETTGLDPQGGDEIISIGAIRIVNGRLLGAEKFDQLIDPGRSLPWESVKYHGIRPEMLTNQPLIEEVLPRFHQFVGDTVLVGHNVAFDMKMLQMKEERTGIRFLNPLLDTMLLSDIVHPAHRQHGLQAVADRLGIRITGRHTALGDAIATGEIFIKLLSLLNAQGIHTLKEARKASEKSLYARLKY